MDGRVERWVKLPVAPYAGLSYGTYAHKVRPVAGLDVQVLSEAPLSVRYRLEYWRSTAAMIADYPLFGCGPGNSTALLRERWPGAKLIGVDSSREMLERAMKDSASPDRPTPVVAFRSLAALEDGGELEAIEKQWLSDVVDVPALD